MSRKFLLLLICALASFSVFAQERKTSALFNLVTEKRKALTTNNEVRLFQDEEAQLSPLVNDIVAEKQVLTLNKEASLRLYNNALWFCRHHQILSPSLN